MYIQSLSMFNFNLMASFHQDRNNLMLYVNYMWYLCTRMSDMHLH